MRNAVLAGDLHQIGGLPEQARDFLVLQTGFLHPIVSSRIGPFASAERRCYMRDMRRWRLLLSVAFLTLCAEQSAVAQSATITVVNSASYGNFIAPESIATVFGANLSFGTATAVLNDDRQLPTVLGQTRVEINGVAAALYFVSPGQINLLVPAGLTTGTATVVVRSTATGATQNGTAQIQPAAPGIFASDGSGSGPGAILNAINFRPAPFLVLTDSDGSPVRTVLAVFGTGLRNAVMVSAFAQDPAGNRFPMIVQFAGPAPGFFGLDQVNVLLPPDIDGAGTTQFILTADGVSANVVTFQMDFIPAVLVQPATLTLTPSVVTAGDSTVLTVGLTGVARLSGYPVGLQSSNAAAPVIAQLIVPAGKASAQTTVMTAAVTSTTMATLAASGSGVTLTTKLEIDPPSAVQLAGISVPPPALAGGRDRTGIVTLTSSAPAGGVRVQLASDSDKGSRPAVRYGAVRPEFGGFHHHDSTRDQCADGYADGYPGPRQLDSGAEPAAPAATGAGREHGSGRESRNRHDYARRPGAGDRRHGDAAIHRYGRPSRAGDRPRRAELTDVHREHFDGDGPPHGDDYGYLRVDEADGPVDGDPAAPANSREPDDRSGSCHARDGRAGHGHTYQPGWSRGSPRSIAE